MALTLGVLIVWFAVGINTGPYSDDNCYVPAECQKDRKCRPHCVLEDFIGNYELWAPMNGALTLMRCFSFGFFIISWVSHGYVVGAIFAFFGVIFYHTYVLLLVL